MTPCNMMNSDVDGMWKEVVVTQCGGFLTNEGWKELVQVDELGEATGGTGEETWNTSGMTNQWPAESMQERYRLDCGVRQSQEVENRGTLNLVANGHCGLSESGIAGIKKRPNNCTEHGHSWESERSSAKPDIPHFMEPNFDHRVHSSPPPVSAVVRPVPSDATRPVS